ncbi:MAG: DUF4037 domain-containing protein, partial [Rectinemataceae bacterium]|nr:DUF4037 domain-containing protein [Rectinemataceae bacterium]
VECVAVGEHAEKDTLDPYFALVLDVYITSRVPDPPVRQIAFGNPGAFESARVQTKDRFLLEGLPVRVEYKKISEIDRLLDHSLDFLKILKNSGTYPLYRLQTARILFKRSGWIDGARSRLGQLGDEFWLVMHKTFLSKMEHYFADLGEAILCEDNFYYTVSAAGFLRFAAASLFMANRRFEPSHREINAQLEKLPRLPDDFPGCWENFLSEDDGSSRSRKRGLAELIARQLVSFY